MNTLTTLPRILLVPLAVAALGLAGCGQDSPTAPNAPGSGAGTYDGTWTCTTALGPRWSLSFAVVDDTVVHVDVTYFLDLLRCLREGSAVLTPRPPVPIVNDAFALSGTASPAALSIDIAASFTSASTASGTVTFVYREAGNPDCDKTLASAFTAVRS